MVVLESDAAGDVHAPIEESEKQDEVKVPSLLSLEIFRITKDGQQQHGLRHGDYQRYRGYCSRRIRRLRKVLKLPQGDRRHYRRKDVTPNHLTSAKAETRMLCIPLLQAERAWAHAMQLRQESNTEPRKKFHLHSRLKKACVHAETLLELCESGVCDARTRLEASAYSAWLRGVLLLELQRWRAAAEALQTAQLVLVKLADAVLEDERKVYSQKMEELKPSLRFCAYNAGDAAAAGELLALRAQGVDDNLDTLMAQAKESLGGAHRTVTWRGRSVAARPERARLLLAALQALPATLAAAASVEDKIQVLEGILMDCKDAISALKDEMKTDPKLRGDSDEQLSGAQHMLAYLMHTRLVRTIERNNLLVEQAEAARRANAPLDGKKVRPQDLTRLYEIILQNFSELQQLPGFESDAEYQREVQTEMRAYQAFRCYYIAQVLTALRRFREALAMLERSESYLSEAGTKLQDHQLVAKLETLKGMIESCKFEVHADSVLEDDEEEEEAKHPGSGRAFRDKKPLVERLDEYREDTVLLTKSPNVYKLPPAMEAVPCKPLFFDLACNFIEFPNLDDKTGAGDNKKGGLTGLVKGFLGWGKGDK